MTIKDRSTCRSAEEPSQKNAKKHAASEKDHAALISSPIKLQSGSHPSLNGLSALFLALDSNEFVRQPSDVRSSHRSYIFRVRRTVLESLSDSIDTVDQDFLLSAPNDDSFDDLVEIREPVFW